MNEEKAKTKVKSGNPFSVVSLIVSILSLGLAIVSFLFAKYPQLNKINDNYLEKANAGDLASQAFLAQYYYDVKNIEQCFYWNEVIAMNESEYQGKAYNNLAFLKLLLQKNDLYYINDHKTALELFLKAGEAGEDTAYINAYVLIAGNPKELFEGMDVDIIKQEIVDLIVEKGMYDHDLMCSYSSEWEHPELVDSTTELTDTETERYVLTGKNTKTVFGETITVYAYLRYRAKNKIPMLDYRYMPYNT